MKHSKLIYIFLPVAIFFILTIASILFIVFVLNPMSDKEKINNIINYQTINGEKDGISFSFDIPKNWKSELISSCKDLCADVCCSDLHCIDNENSNELPVVSIYPDYIKCQKDGYSNGQIYFYVFKNYEGIGNEGLGYFIKAEIKDCKPKTLNINNNEIKYCSFIPERYDVLLYGTGKNYSKWVEDHFIYLNNDKDILLIRRKVWSDDKENNRKDFNNLLQTLKVVNK